MVAPQRRELTQRNRSKGDATDASLERGGIEVDQQAEGPSGLAKPGEEPALVQPCQLCGAEADDRYRLANYKRKVCMLGQVAALELKRERTLTNIGDIAPLQLVAKTFLVGAAQQAGSKGAVNLLCAGENFCGDRIEVLVAIDCGTRGGRREAREHHALDAIL